MSSQITPNPGPAPVPGMPLFYRRPQAMQAGQHSHISLKPVIDYRFAARTNAVPLTGAEFFQAQRDYPIVFSDEDLPLPLAILGVKDRENLYVEADGGWRRGAYIPAYVRRYPFIFAESPDTKDLTLCLDEGSDLVEASADRPFFRAGQPTDVTKQALDFCLSYQRNHEATREFSQALKQAELFILRDARIRIGPQDFAMLKGFRMVDEERFNQLPADTFLDWRNKGWLSLVYAHLLSLGSWDRLAQLAPGGAATA